MNSRNTKGGSKNSSKSISLYKRASALGEPIAKYNLALHYISGNGLEKNFNKAVEYLRDSAEKNYAPSAFKLGELYSKGIGVKRSKYASCDWYYKAGIIYLEHNERDEALKSVDAIEHTCDKHPLKEKLLSSIYSDIDSQTKNHKDNTKSYTKTGTAWLVSSDVIVTSYHVVSKGSKFTVHYSGGHTTNANVFREDKANDIVLLKLSEPFPGITPLIITDKSPEIGSTIFTIGYPQTKLLGSGVKLSEGIVSANMGLNNDYRFYQSSIPVMGGNSGGPIFNEFGYVTGIVMMKINQKKAIEKSGDLFENVSYALKSAYLMPLLTDISAKIKDEIIPSRAKKSITEIYNEVKNSVLLITIE